MWISGFSVHAQGGQQPVFMLPEHFRVSGAVYVLLPWG